MCSSDIDITVKVIELIINGIELIINGFIGAGLIYIGWQANNIAKAQKAETSFKASKAEKDVYYDVYNKLSEGLGLVMSEGRVTDTAKALFWKARDKARLELPEEIEQYTQDIFDRMWKAYCLSNHKIRGDDKLPKGEERTNAVEEHSDIILSLIDEKPYEIFKKYMKV